MAATLLVRADADGRTGAGHVMRCLALAQAWKADGGRAVFASRCPAKRLQEQIRAAGPEFVPLERSHPDPSDLDFVETMLDEMQADRAESRPIWVVLDGYHFDSAYQQAIRRAGVRLLVVDDMVRLDRYHADLLLNQNLHAEHLQYACDPEAVLLLGSRYVLLRQEFHAYEFFRRQTPPVARRVLVTLGGADPENVTGMVVEALERLAKTDFGENRGAGILPARQAGSLPHFVGSLPHLQVKVLVGPANPRRDVLQEQAASSKLGSVDVQIVGNEANVPELMVWADAAVSAAGSTCWELAWMQLPAVVIVLAENQEPVARRLSEQGAVTSLGRADRLTPEKIAAALSALCCDHDLRAAQSAAGRRLIDGRGARRVVAVMHALDGRLPEDRPALRPVGPDDLLPLWRLANDPSNRRASILSTDPIALDTHTRWFHQRLSSPATRIWVLDLQGLMLGSIRYDRTEPDVAEISLAVHPAFRKRGLATRLIEATRAAACRELEVDRLRAVIRGENFPSMRTFAKAGFREVEVRQVRGQSCHVLDSAEIP